MQTYQKSTYIKCTQDELFDFHLDSKNLVNITPSNIKVKLITKDFKAQEGEVLKLKTIKYFIPTRWDVKIKKLDKPRILIDLALKSPFKHWEHQHHFIKHENFTELKDVVYYDLPFGFLGDLVEPLIEKDLDEMFSFRHKQTKKILENKEK